MGILSAPGLPGGFLWRGTIPFTIGCYEFCYSYTSEYSPSWLFFHSRFTFETVRLLSLRREAGRGRLGCCIHVLQLWFYSHLSIIARDQPMGFMDRNRIWAIVSLDLPFSRDIDGCLRYLCSLSPTGWA